MRFSPRKEIFGGNTKVVYGVVSRHLREYIVRISDQKVLAQFFSPEEKASQKPQNKDVSGFIDISKYALYHEVFNVKNIKDIRPLIFHQKKFKNGVLNGSEILVRFQNPNPMFDELLPLHEVFAFVDLFEQYKVVSRRILEKAIEESITLGHPFSLNVKCEELADADFADFLISRIKKAGLKNGDSITLEILESSALGPEDGHIIKNLKALKTYGFHFALDDFR
jgi:EAL domain-containing protein (putative c-di-GMP-specific phosphodiesterase class I)